jgi:Heparinase II/III-like protein/Heparinase II/III N-terminus
MNLRNWRQLGRRVGQMEWAELRDRIRQEISGRQDGFLAHLDYDFARNALNSSDRKPGAFFFSPDSVDSIVAILRQRVPGQAEQILEQAEKICCHQFDLLGYKNLDYGVAIDWHLDSVHGKRAPRKPFYKVRYLDFNELGDAKVTWELNRHQHLVTLAKAYRLTGNSRFADEVLRQWRHWWMENRYPVGINWASSLEVAFRSLSWIWTYYLLEGSPDVPPLRDEWLRGLALHGRHIERYLSTYFSPNTHLLGEGVGLFFLGLLCPELAAAERWKSLGLEIVLREAGRQVQADGFHFEQSTYYHVYALDFFLHFAVLAALNHVPMPKTFEQVLEKMLTALCLLSRWGPPPGYGDDDGGRLFDPRRNRSEHLLDPLATGAILFRSGEFKSAAENLREETVWLLGAEGVKQWDELEIRPIPAGSAALQGAGLYLLTAPHQSTQLVVDAGPQGTQSGGHGHADALAVCMQSHGRPLLIDPGTREYAGAGRDRDWFRGTAMHNTLTVDGVNQAEPVTAFSWKRLTQTHVEQWIQGKGFDLLSASHDGYEHLAQPVRHRRLVLSLKNGLYLVRDVIAGHGTHQLELSWHLNQDVQLLDHDVFCVKGASHGLALLPAAQPEPWEKRVLTESWSPAYGQTQAMTVMRFSIHAEVPVESAVLLVSLQNAHSRPGVFTRLSSSGPDSPIAAYQYAVNGGKYWFLFGGRMERWRQGPLSSDAEFVCWAQRPDKTEQRLMLSNGSYVTVDGGPDLRFNRSVSWGEAICDRAEKKVFSSDLEAATEKSKSGDRERLIQAPR